MSTDIPRICDSDAEHECMQVESRPPSINPFDGEDHPPTYIDSFPGSGVMTSQDAPQSRNTVFHPLDPAASFDISQTVTKKSKTGSTNTVVSHILTTNPSCLNKYMAAEASTMPTPYVRIQGSNCDVKVPLTSLLRRAWHITKTTDKGMLAYRGSCLRDEERGDPTICMPEDWYRDICKSSWRPKIFTLTRRVTGWDKKFLVNSLQELLENSGALNRPANAPVRFARHLRKFCAITPRYKIRICLENRATVLYSDHWLNTLRLNSRIWWIFVLLQFWIVAWPFLHLLTKQWDCVSVDWPVRVFWKDGDVTKGETGGWPVMDEEWDGSGGRGRLGRYEGQTVEEGKVKRAGMNEGEWVERWGEDIISAIVKGSKGWLREE